MTISRPRMLVFAYACEPGRGSEPGAGWGVVRALSEFADCVVLVGPEHRTALDAWTASHGTSALRFVTVPDMAWPPVAQRGRLAWFAAYLRWIPRARAMARTLHAERPFDLAWHVTYSTYWLPSPVTALGVPRVWGPVGGAVTTPAALHSLLDLRGRLVDLIDRVAVSLCSHLPAVRRTWWQTDVRLVQNEDTAARLTTHAAQSTVVLNHAVFVDAPTVPAATRTRELVMAGALESRKGVALVLHALAETAPDLHLTIIGDGPERGALEQLADTLRLRHRVTFTGMQPRHTVQARYASCAAALFTGLREEGGLALAEAMVAGTPVIVLDVGGAGWLARQGVDPRRVTCVAPGTRAETVQRLATAMSNAVETPCSETSSLLDVAAHRETLQHVARTALAARRVTVSPPRGDASTDALPVTVVIPVFNGARYLAAAVQSVQEQSHRALQVMIVDDGSTDETPQIAAQLAMTDVRVQVVTIPNGGRARARNVGVRSAHRAPYVAFLDADDLWDRDKLRTQLAHLQRDHTVVGVGARMRYISSSGSVLGETGQPITTDDHRAITRGELSPFPISSCLVVRREAFDALGGFDEVLREAEDLDFIARLARLGTVATVPAVLGSYRIHPDSAMATARARVNMYARFVRQRLARQDAGGTLAWETFAAAYSPTFAERRRDAVETWYRSAALWRGENQPLRAAQFALLAGLSAPLYTLRRAMRQRARQHA